MMTQAPRQEAVTGRVKNGRMITFREYNRMKDDRTDKYVADEIKKRKLATVVVNATDDRKMVKGKPTFTMHHTGSSTIYVYLRKMKPSGGVMSTTTR